MDVICRFGELTKTEIIVLAFLYASRNRKTGQCNPGRQTITEMTGIAKTHLSVAVRGLADKQFIGQSNGGGFELKSYGFGNSKVTDSVTSQREKVTDSVTKVTDSVTKSYGFGNSETDAHIKVRARVLNTEGTQKEHREESMSAFADADVDVIFAYWQVQLKHPNAKMTPERRTAIRSRLRDGYLPAQILRAIDGCKNSPHHQGRNETGTIYDDLTLICRNGSKVEQFISYNSRKGNENGAYRGNITVGKSSSVERIADHADIISQYPSETEFGHIA